MTRPARAARRGTRGDAAGAALLVSLALLGLLALVIPTVIIVITSFDSRQVISFPPSGFSLDRYRRMLVSPEIRACAALSALTAAVAVAIDLLLGIPAAIALVRRHFRGQALLLGFLQSPMMLPGIVIGIAILLLYSSLGLGPSVPLMMVSHVVLTLPFVIRITMARMERTDKRLEEAAANLGANRLQVFWYVVLPQLWPGIVSGAAFAFLISFDNLTVSLFTAPVRQRPLPIELFYRMRFDLDPIVSAIATCQIGLALVVLAIGGRLVETLGSTCEKTVRAAQGL